MSDTMFYGVLRMPYEMTMENELSRQQFYSRAQEAADRLEVAEAKATIAPAAQGNVETIRQSAFQEAIQACMIATPDRAKVRRIGEAAHYMACADAIRRIAAKAAS